MVSLGTVLLAAFLIGDPESDTAPMDFTLINLDFPTETRTFEKGRFETYEVGPMTLGRATYAR